MNIHELQLLCKVNDGGSSQSAAGCSCVNIQLLREEDEREEEARSLRCCRLAPPLPWQLTADSRGDVTDEVTLSRSRETGDES